MYNSFVHKKHSQQLEHEERNAKKKSHWLSNYRNSVRPALVERYSRRINNFIIRVPPPARSWKKTRRNSTSTGSKPKPRPKSCSRKSTGRSGSWATPTSKSGTPTTGTASSPPPNASKKITTRRSSKPSTATPVSPLEASPRNRPTTLPRPTNSAAATKSASCTPTT